MPATDPLGYGSSSLQPTSLSWDGRMLAVPQPQSVVVDLTTGDHQRYDVPGFNQTAIWAPDGDHVFDDNRAESSRPAAGPARRVGERRRLQRHVVRHNVRC
ncbi:MAG: hypothetical protein H0V32_02605 [Nocardioidaceae bacterium]|nr:hypothetical protein [Nocardioidaceae bacterium]